MFAGVQISSHPDGAPRVWMTPSLVYPENPGAATPRFSQPQSQQAQVPSERFGG